MSSARSFASVLAAVLVVTCLGVDRAVQAQTDSPAAVPTPAPAEPIATPAQPAAEAAEPVAAAGTTPANAAGHPCDALNCGTTGCKNYPVTYSNCNTTPNGPARADLVTAPTSFLYCEHSRYALC